MWQIVYGGLLSEGVWATCTGKCLDRNTIFRKTLFSNVGAISKANLSQIDSAQVGFETTAFGRSIRFWKGIGISVVSVFDMRSLSCTSGGRGWDGEQCEK